MTFEEAMTACAEGAVVTREAWLPFKWAAYLIDDEAKSASDWKIVDNHKANRRRA